MRSQTLNEPMTPVAMRFQARDGEILQSIYDFDGVVAKRHLKSLFWPKATERAMEKRLSLLYHNGYLDWPSRDQWRREPIPESICWLGWKGIVWLSGQRGLHLNETRAPNESQLHRLERDLRSEGIRWVREPRWSQLTHDLAILDIRLAVMAAIGEQRHLSLAQWISEGVFASAPDVVTFIQQSQTGKERQQRRPIRPDGYFVIHDQQRAEQGEPAQARFLLELDNASHDVTSFGREKVTPGIAYLKSQAYRERFGDGSGRWLVVTTGGKRRLDNLMRQTEQVAGRDAHLFWFTTLSEVERGNILLSKIWHRMGAAEAVPLFEPVTLGSRLIGNDMF